MANSLERRGKQRKKCAPQKHAACEGEPHTGEASLSLLVTDNVFTSGEGTEKAHAVRCYDCAGSIASC